MNQHKAVQPLCRFLLHASEKSVCYSFNRWNWCTRIRSRLKYSHWQPSLPIFSQASTCLTSCVTEAGFESRASTWWSNKWTAAAGCLKGLLCNSSTLSDKISKYDVHLNRYATLVYVVFSHCILEMFPQWKPVHQQTGDFMLRLLLYVLLASASGRISNTSDINVSVNSDTQ